MSLLTEARLLFRLRAPEPPDPGAFSGRRLLLASEGRPFAPATVEFAVRLAKQSGAKVQVFSVARIWGTSLGLPMPGLLPSKRDWDEQREIVARAVKALRREGLEAEGHVLGTRKTTKRVLSEAARLRCDGIVMAAGPRKPWVVAQFMWSQEPHRVRRRSPVPVYLVPVTEQPRGGGRGS